MAIQAKQGRSVFGVDMKIVGEDGKALPHDGVSAGELMVRGRGSSRATSRGRARARWSMAGSRPATFRPSTRTASWQITDAARM